MNPDVVGALEDLQQKGFLAPEDAAPLLREARGELVSVRGELAVLLYAGVLAATGAVPASDSS